MRIAIIASGSRGDVQPYIALGKGLKQAGYEIRLVTHENFKELVDAHGLEFWPVDINVNEIAQDAAMVDLLEKGNFLRIMSQMAKEAERGALQLAEVGLQACEGVDLVLAGMGGLYTGLAIAEKLDLPFLQAYVVPFSPTRTFSSVLLPKNLPGFASPLNRLSHHLTRQMIWQGFRFADKRARQEVLGLPAASFWGPYNSKQAHQLPILYGFSPSVIGRPADWGPHIHIAGYWYLDSADEWVPPADLEAFLQDGSPPVYIGFGSISNRNPEETADLVLEALLRSNQRGIMLAGWGGLSKADLPANVFMVDSIPHAWLFPRVAAVVHHGGVGTTAAGLRAGVPSIVVPFFGDQSFWGQRVADLGVGSVPIPRKRLNVDRLTQALETVVRDQSIGKRAAELGAKIRAEDGIAGAVAVLQSIEKLYWRFVNPHNTRLQKRKQ